MNTMNYIIILNDGTDEIFNLNGITATDPLDFAEQYDDYFDITKEGEDLQEELDYRTYLKAHDKHYYNGILELSNKPGNLTDEEMQFLNNLKEKFISHTEILKQFS